MLKNNKGNNEQIDFCLHLISGWYGGRNSHLKERVLSLRTHNQN